MPPKFSSSQLNASCPYALPEELQYVRQLMNDLSSKNRALMIGAGPGVFALAMLEDRKNPPWLYVVESGSFDYLDTHLEAAGVNLEKVVHIHGNSSVSAKNFLRHSFELILVDGDHSYEGVSQDILGWWPTLVPDGVMFFHDYLERESGIGGTGVWSESDVAKAIHDHKTDEWKLLRQVGISIAYRKIVNG